jgi:hypothetical protein
LKSGQITLENWTLIMQSSIKRRNVWNRYISVSQRSK